MRRDYYTNTEADAGRWERAHAEADYDYERPSRAEADADEAALAVRRTGVDPWA